MKHCRNGNRPRDRYRIGVCATLIAFAASAAAEPFEFVAHNGFEACWSTSKDATTMSQLIVDLVDGAPGCIPANTGGDVSSCYTSVCSGREAGCPTVLHGGSSQYAQGQSRFDAQGGLDSVAGKVTFSGLECDFSINTANVVLYYDISYFALPEYGLVADGNNGYYLTALQVNNVSATGLTGGDVSISGNILCSAANFSSGFFTGMLAQVQPSIQSAVQPTLDHAWCPWPF